MFIRNLNPNTRMLLVLKSTPEQEYKRVLEKFDFITLVNTKDNI